MSCGLDALWAKHARLGHRHAFGPGPLHVQELIAFAVRSPGTFALMALNIVASLVALYKLPALIEGNLLRPYWLFKRHQYHTLVTSGFLHADLAHLFFNMFTLWAFAVKLEQVMGTAQFLALYAFGLLMSDLGTYLKHRDNPGYQSLGASGAILAVLFASIVYFPTASLFIMPIPVPIPAPVFALVYLAYSYYASRQSEGRINHDAHLSGAVAGVVFVGLADPERLMQALRSFTG